MPPITSTFGPDLSPGRAAIVKDLRARAGRRRQFLADLGLGSASLGVASFAAAVVPGIIGLDLGDVSGHLKTASAALLCVAVLAADRAADLAVR